MPADRVNAAASARQRDATGDNWAQDPYLSILGHIGMFLGVAFFTCVVPADKATA